MNKVILFIAFWILALELISQSNTSPVREVYISKIPKPSAPAYLVVSDIEFSDRQGNNNQLLDVNEKAEIKFTVTNKGKGVAYSLLAGINEKNSIRGLDYVQEKQMGDLQPDAEVTITLPVSGNMHLETGKADFEILIKEGNAFDADPFRVLFNTQKFRNPSLLVADHKFTTNEKGRIKLGHPVTLNVIIQNEGQGEAMDVKVNFVNPPDVFPANETVFDLGTLKPNESRNLAYEFFANKKYNQPEIPIQINITESHRKYGQIKSLTVSLEQTLAKTQQFDINGQYEKEVAIKKISLTSDVDKGIPETQTNNENTFALIIGNEDYSSYQQNISSEMNVAFATNDATVFKEYCFKTLGVPESNITLLLNATAGQMHQAIDKVNKLTQVTKGTAKLIVYYAGHGLPDEITKEPYLIPVDVSGSNVQSAIKLSTLYSKVTEFPSQQVVIFLDACFSGGGRESGLMAARGVRVKPKNEYLKGNIIVFTASSGDESSLPWKDKQHGIFTYFLLKKLQDTKGQVPLRELGDFLTESVALESVRTNSKRQNPQILSSETLSTSWEKWKLR
jgi:hypothetical protein